MSSILDTTYVAGREFVLVSDHASLKYILNNVSPNSKINRWASALMGFRFVFRYKPGSLIPSDSLSRIHAKEVNLCESTGDNSLE